MHLGMVRGKVVLSRMTPELLGNRFLIVEPINRENLLAGNGKGGGRELVVADHGNLGAADGQMVAYVEGREGANAYHPQKVPVDAYLSLIVDDIQLKEHGSGAS
jgi:microcompartment protein CcmK/EutM